MAFWNRGREASQKRPIIEVIKYDGPNDILVWKFPSEDFNTNTRLIVGPSQEAIFVKGGQVLERFISGTYTLNTKNYPFIRSLVERLTDGVSPFSCKVYYVNKVTSMGIEWGTDTPISVIDPVYNVPIDVRSYGDFSLQVEDGQMLLEKLVGQAAYGISHKEIRQFFSNIMATQVRGVISSTMLVSQLSPIGIDAHLANMSAVAAERLRPIFKQYGMMVNHFTIAAISAPELDAIKQKARVLQEHRMQTEVTTEDKRKWAKAQAFENRELGVNEHDKWVAQIGQTLAGNQGPTLGGADGLAFIGIAGGNTVQPSAAGATDIAKMLIRTGHPAQHMSDASLEGALSSALEEVPTASATQPAQESFEARAMKVKFLFDNGMISQEQYQQKIDELMDEI